MTWSQIRQCSDYMGKWIALEPSRYDEQSLQPEEGEVVDADVDLTALCARMRQSDRSSCAIRFCEVEEAVPHSSLRPATPSLPVGSRA